MIDAATLAEIVNDPRLTPDAVRLVLHVAARGPGKHEIDGDEARMLLGCKSDKPVYNARERAVNRGYLRWQQGGQGKGVIYEYIGHRADVNAVTSDTGPKQAPVVVDDDGDTTPLISPLHPLAPAAEEAIERQAEALAGCRDSLRDYLRLRVAPPRQSSFVYDIAGKIKGLGFNWHGVPEEDRPGFVSATLNELAATDEAKEYRYPPGDPRNARTKLGILVQARASPPQRAQGATPARSYSPRDKPPPDQQEYHPKPFRGFNG